MAGSWFPVVRGHRIIETRREYRFKYRHLSSSRKRVHVTIVFAHFKRLAEVMLCKKWWQPLINPLCLIRQQSNCVRKLTPRTADVVSIVEMTIPLRIVYVRSFAVEVSVSSDRLLILILLIFLHFHSITKFQGNYLLFEIKIMNKYIE